MKQSIYIGFDPRQAAAFAVARASIRARLGAKIPVKGLVLAELQRQGIYTRQIDRRASAADGPVMWDVLSDAPMSTEHANARFLVPHLAVEGLALFVDGDVMARGDLGELFWLASKDPSKALWCVHHDFAPSTTAKMDGQVQTRYARKNWSSVMMFNCDHPATQELTLEMVNMLPGRDLHRFCWLDDTEIGEFGPEWNWLVGHSEGDAKLVHFTDGVPDMRGYEGVPFADEWRSTLEQWAAGTLSLPG